MAGKHWFYFVICDNDPEAKAAREEALMECARRQNFSVSREEFGGCISLQFNTDSEDSAVSFKLCAETALSEGHPNSN